MRKMKKYASFFRIQLQNGLQYRAAALGGLATQIAWGFMEILLFTALHRDNAESFPMEMQALSSYIWLQQAFLTLFMPWNVDGEVFSLIQNGNVAYALCRPLDLYAQWISKAAGRRIAMAGLRCLPVLAVGFLLPAPYGMALPPSLTAFLLFLLTGVLSFLLMLTIEMLLYVICFLTLSPWGVRSLLISTSDLLSGALLPIPFLPTGVRRVVELLPFACLQNLPFRVWGGDIAGPEVSRYLLVQLFWLGTCFLSGRLLMKRALRQAVAQGG